MINIMTARGAPCSRRGRGAGVARRPLALPRIAALGAILLAAPQAWAAEPIHHELRVALDPRTGRIEVHDRIRLPSDLPLAGLEFELGREFTPALGSALTELVDRPAAGGLKRYRAKATGDGRTVEIRYSGTVGTAPVHPEHGMPLADVSPEGAYLDGSSGWYPRVEDRLLTFDLSVALPPGWLAISQGSHSDREPGAATWQAATPQDDIYLVAGPYTMYRAQGDSGEAQVFLRDADGALARRYLEATEDYLALYSRLIGPYPFPKFAAVENRWETGYGMPSFTLLGPRVMRLPFLLASSYPHEILHNWWGNSVYVDFGQGNWSEGLTTYLADHLIQEGRGGGANYRRSVLQKYADYVAGDEDFPLSAFRYRHSGESQAVGYGKTMMLFHMLRRRMGEEPFVRLLREFYQRHRYRAAAFSDWQRALETATGAPWGSFFEQWVERAGAPVLALEELRVEALAGAGFRVSGRLRQAQPGPAYRLRLPVAITLEGAGEVEWRIVEMDEGETAFSATTASRPLRVDVDPRFDVFRRLSSQELPPAIGQLFGATTLTLVLPEQAPAPLVDAYQALAEAWKRRFAQIRVIGDGGPLPAEGAVWVLGRANRHAAAVTEPVRARYRKTLADSADTLQPAASNAGQSLILTVEEGGRTIGWVGEASAQAIAALARKLPHYGKYSYLVFAGDEAHIRERGQWPVLASPLSAQIGEAQVPMGALPRESFLGAQVGWSPRRGR